MFLSPILLRLHTLALEMRGTILAPIGPLEIQMRTGNTGETGHKTTYYGTSTTEHGSICPYDQFSPDLRSRLLTLNLAETFAIQTPLFPFCTQKRQLAYAKIALQIRIVHNST